MKKILIILSIVFCPCLSYIGMACTNLIVGKGASVDGSVILSYSSDDYGAFGHLFFYPRAKHAKGQMRQLYHYETLNYLGEIPEAEETYQVVGLCNEYQLTIFETTFGGREELWDGPGLFDYGSLMTVTLQRCKTARQAVEMIGSLANEYGYVSEGESFSVADKNEVWIMEMIGKGKDTKGAVWVARRIPDDMICAHANHSRIRRFPLKDKDNCLYSHDVISFARQKGYFSGKDEDFSFSEAYAPADFGAKRFCEARVWSFFNKWGKEDMQKYLPYAMGVDKDGDAHEMPLWIQPKTKLSVQDVKNMMRDHYEDTPMDIRSGLGAGAWEMPYRPTPLTFEVDSVKYFNERPISTQQASNIYVSQLRSWLPDYIGSCLWYGNDEANMVALTPIYPGSMKRIPYCYSDKSADAFTFSFKNAFWVCNWVSNMVYLRYSLLFPELKNVRDRLEADYNSMQAEIEEVAKGRGHVEGAKYLSDYSTRMAQGMISEWNDLAKLIIVKYNDMAVKQQDSNGKYLHTPGNAPRPVIRPGYPEAYRRKIVQESGDKYKMPQ